MRLTIPGVAAVYLAFALGCQQASTPVSTTATQLQAPATVAPATPVPSSRTPAPSPLESAMPSEWLAFGDSITQDAFAVDLAWKDRLGPQAPVPVNAGVRGDTTTNALARIDEVLAAHPHARYVGVAFGTNDCWGMIPVETYRTQLQSIIDRIKAAGMTPVISTIPYSPDSELAKVPDYNRAIAALQAANGLPEGPDLYALVQANESFLRPDGVHMTPEGSQALQRAWADVAARLSW